LPWVLQALVAGILLGYTRPFTYFGQGYGPHHEIPRLSSNSWHKDEEEASRQGATIRDNKTRSNIETATTNGAGKGHRKDETAKEESTRELADRVSRHVAD
ncbi:unnamed protein product, partial [Ectocarpus fasciculatus]